MTKPFAQKLTRPVLTASGMGFCGEGDVAAFGEVGGLSAVATKNNMTMLYKNRHEGIMYEK